MTYTLQKSGPIAVFDSGVGGVSVLKELLRLMPGEDYLYFGDSKHAPYGVKDTADVRALTCENARRLFDRGAKGLVVACNTATSAAVRSLREQYPYIPIVGIEPAVKPAALCGSHPRVLVMATPMTIREEKLKRLMEQYADAAELIPLACPGLMDFIERGDLDGEDLHSYLTQLLADYREGAVDSAVLGCTHYPFARRQIQRVLGSGVKIFDGGEGTAREMKRRLSEKNLLHQDGQGHVVFENSAEDPGKIALCEMLLSLKI
ncbi:MAG: glutamate racemase [Muribaculaceae bacterium]|nr:glutamate racemase [Roseburia sp.]MCM1430187.1 glutamate racemase [Muribaculaceae bacterium]MCM1493117.1 glutamate racemase [Muribaculaceae bacterium]